MKIPSKLKIGGHTITVHVADRTKDNNCGEWDPYSNTIELDKRQPMSQLEVTLIHEVIHALNINIEPHAMVEALAQQFYQVIVDNHLVFDGKDKKK
jgi:hypothetical protein